MRNYIVLTIVLLGLYGCGERKEPLSCNSPSVIDAVLRDKTTGPVYYSRSLVNAKIVQKTDQSILCGADLVIQSNLDNSRKLSIPTTFNVYKVNKKSKSSTSNLIFTPLNQKKLNDWLTSINLLTKQLGDYQLAAGGALYVMKGEQLQTLFFNGKPVAPKMSNQMINIEKSYTLGNNSAYLIGSYTGGTIDADTLNNYLVLIESSGTYKISQQFGYQPNGIMQTNESLVINGVVPFRPYAESTDFPVYLYTNKGQLITTRAAKPDSYYEAKFANMTALSIVNIAKADQCFNLSENQVDTSHACSYGTKYCFMFKSMKDKGAHDDSYAILEKACPDN